jgi:hypothetical protein
MPSSIAGVSHVVLPPTHLETSVTWTTMERAKLVWPYEHWAEHA